MIRLSSSDRYSLIRLASTLPVGSSERKALLESLKMASSNSLDESEGPKPFSAGEWNLYSRAEPWLDDSGKKISEPLILDATIRGSLPDEEGFEIPDVLLVTLIADANGLIIDLSHETIVDMGDATFFNRTKIDPRDASGALKKMLSSLLSGKIPSGFRRVNWKARDL